MSHGHVESWGVVLGIFFSGLVFIAGLIAMLRGASSRFYWLETPGQVVKFIEHIDETDDGKHISYTPIVKYVVKGKEYTGQSRYRNQRWHKQDFYKEVIVLYDPENPETIYLKDGAMLRGCFVMTVALIAIGLLMWFGFGVD